MKSLVVGLSFGQLYVDVLKQIGHRVITCDLHRPADYYNIWDVISQHHHFDTVHICTPNFTHEDIAKKLFDHADIIFVEKPGFQNNKQWQDLQSSNLSTRLIMTKNNMWRNNISDIVESSKECDTIKINWINKNRIPSPGSWFTDKDKSFGGVSKDLLPHLLSIFIAINQKNYKKYSTVSANKKQKWTIENCINGTNYGNVIKDGVYNVDDEVEVELTDSTTNFIIKADWRSDTVDDIAIHYYKHGNLIKTIPLGLCPVEAYQSMILDCIKNKDNDDFWKQQAEYDEWIQTQINI